MIYISMTCIVFNLNCCTCNHQEPDPSDPYCCVQPKMSMGLFMALSAVSQLKCLQIWVLTMCICVPISSHRREAADGGTRHWE